MPLKPILDGVELQQVERIEGDQLQVLEQHRVAALEGDFFQPLGQRAVRINLSGVLTGSAAAKSLETLRGKFRSAQPVMFVADIATATKTSRMLIHEINVRELAGKPERFEYAITLVQYIGPSGAKATTPGPVAAPMPAVSSGQLAIEVSAGHNVHVDARTLNVSVEGTQEKGKRFAQSLNNRSLLTWKEDRFPPGYYSVNVVGTNPPIAGSADVIVRPGQTSRVAVQLSGTAPIARAFVVHFGFDKAFIEPGMLPVLGQVAQYAQSHPEERLAIVGHTDLAGPPEYNQRLSERRSRSVLACLTQGQQTAANQEWKTLRRTDSWGRREYETMLRDLGYLRRELESDSQSATSALQAFQRDRKLPVDGLAGDSTWTALIQAYLSRTSLAVPIKQILDMGDAEGHAVRRWQGRGAEDSIRNTPDAWRPNRRTELIFVKAKDLPGREWLVQPAETETFVVQGSIHRDDGTPLSHVKYVLTAPDGEYMDGERPGSPGQGQPIPGKTAADGSFVYGDHPKGAGIYTLEIKGPFVVRLKGQQPETAKGPYTWKRLDGTSNFNVLAAPRRTIV